MENESLPFVSTKMKLNFYMYIGSESSFGFFDKNKRQKSKETF